MPATSKFYRLDAANLDKILETLHLQSQKAQPSRFQRAAFRLLQITVYVFGSLWLSVWLTENTPLEETFNSLAGIFGFGKWAVLVLTLSIFLILIGIALVLVNLPLVLKIWRQLSLARELNLLLPEEMPSMRWEFESAEREFWYKVAGGLLALIVAVGLYSWYVGWHGWLKLLVVLVVCGGPAYLIFARKKIPLRVLKIGIWLIGALLVLALVPPFLPDSIKAENRQAFENFYVAVFFSFPFLVFLGGRILARLDEQLTLVQDVDSLRQTLERKKAEAADSKQAYLEISAGEAWRLAQVERTMIRQSRSEAIASARQSRARGITILKSPTARSQIEKLTPKERFQVESQIQDLALDPRPDGSREDEETAAWIFRLADAPAEIVYKIVDDNRTVKVLEVRKEPADQGREDHG